MHVWYALIIHEVRIRGSCLEIYYMEYLMHCNKVFSLNSARLLMHITRQFKLCKKKYGRHQPA